LIKIFVSGMRKQSIDLVPPPPPMDWHKPSQNPRMVKLRRFEPGRVQGTKKKSAIEQGKLKC
jgi:hypothetical protein